MVCAALARFSVTSWSGTWRAAAVAGSTDPLVLLGSTADAMDWIRGVGDVV